MLSFKNYINESTFNLNSAVDYIFEKYYADFFAKLKTIKQFGIPKPPHTSFLSSADLVKYSKNRIVAKAHKMNPIDIIIQGSVNAYNPKLTYVKVKISGFYDSVVVPLASNIYSDNQDREVVDIILANLTDKSVHRSFREDFSGEKLKNSIAHELNHWVDDTLHNKHIKSHLQKAGDAGVSFESTYKKSSVGLTTPEINSQIHQIKQMRRKYTKIEWDKFNFVEMLKNDNSLFSAIWMRFSYKEQAEWKKLILKRMSREKLLGRNISK